MSVSFGWVQNYGMHKVCDRILDKRASPFSWAGRRSCRCSACLGTVAGAGPRGVASCQACRGLGGHELESCPRAREGSGTHTQRSAHPDSLIRPPLPRAQLDKAACETVLQVLRPMSTGSPVEELLRRRATLDAETNCLLDELAWSVPNTLGSFAGWLRQTNSRAPRGPEPQKQH